MQRYSLRCGSRTALEVGAQSICESHSTDSKTLQPVRIRCRFQVRRLATATAASTSRPDISSRAPPYPKLLQKLRDVRSILGPSRKLSLAEKILYSHLDNPEESLLSNTSNGSRVRGFANLKLKPDRVAMQDASAQMALLQFMSCGLPSTAVPASIHCDHMIVGEKGADVDLPSSIRGNKEVFDFLESAGRKYGIEFWPPGAGIIHQTVLENYASPGLMMLGTDSHTPNAGGLGAIAIGVGGADAVDALVDAPWELKAPKVLGVRLEGELSGWAAPKDVILSLAGQLTVRGGTGYIIEYYGPGVGTLSCTGMATICNMGAEVGATTSLFPFTPRMASYLQSTHRPSIANATSIIASSPDSHSLLRADSGVEYDLERVINLSTIEPHINGPFTPDLSTPLSKFADAVQTNKWPLSVSAGLIGSCTNSSFQDMKRAEDLVKQASAAGLKPKIDFFITPGSEQIRATLEDSSTLETFSSAGGTVLANACGPCIGQWKRTDGSKRGETNAIFSSYNRNFRGRNDGNPDTMNFLASPEIVTAMSYAGSTTFNPLTDAIVTPSGTPFRFSAPRGPELPTTGFSEGNTAFLPSTGSPDPSTPVVIDPRSDRLAVLDPFPPFPSSDLKGLRVLYKVAGKCTTDTISAAGPWLKYKGHLPNISANTLIGAVNAATGEVNVAYDVDGVTKCGIPELAARWKEEGHEWLVVAEHNYGEGSAREHAALQPRYLGGRVILAKSFARIHETNLKKQGVVPLTFATEGEYNLIDACDEVETIGLHDMLINGGQGEVKLVVTKRVTGEKREIEVRHTLSKDQCRFILAGSALNLLAKQKGARHVVDQPTDDDRIGSFTDGRFRMSVAPADTGSDMDLEVAYALCDLETARAREVLAGRKQEVDFNWLERSRAVRDRRDACYVEAWNVELPSVDFSGRPLEDDLGHGQSHRANMVARLARNEYGDQSRSTRGEPSRRGGRYQTHFHGSMGRSQDGGVNRGTMGVQNDAGFNRATLSAGPATAQGTTPRSVAAERPPGSTVKIRCVKPMTGEASEGPTSKTAPERAIQIVGVGTSSTGSRGARANAPPQPIRSPAQRYGRTSSGSRFEKMLAKVERMGEASQNVRGNYPPAPTASANRVARVPQLPFRLASPKGFMENAQKVWRVPGGQGNTSMATAQTSDSATAAAAVGSGRPDMGKTLPHQAVEDPVEELISFEDKGRKQDTHISHDGDDYAALCSLYPHVDPDVILLYLDGCDGKVEDAKDRLGKLGSLSSVDEAADDLVDISNVDLKATASVTTATMPAQVSSLDLMDLIDFGPDLPRVKSSHLLDDELSSCFSALSLAPTLASRSGNIPDGNTGGKAAPIENKHGYHAPPPSSGRPLPPLKPLTYSKWATVHTPVPPSTVSRNTKIPVTSNAPPAPGQDQGQSIRATIRASNSSKATSNHPQERDLTRSIWADEGERGSGPKSYQRRRDY
ncbi:MAG: aconitate hydratase [Geoglossum simile]|nr:MAG: aconitate hydratase [Geoglossum simile]